MEQSPLGQDGREVEGRWSWLGRAAFPDTAVLQERLRQQVLAGESPERLLLLEHDPVLTLGRRARAENVLLPEALLAARGITLHAASRGGDVTYHGPGQLVGYPIVRLRAGVRGHVRGMASAIAEVLGELGIDARYREDAPGLWVGGGEESAGRKICAFGVNVHRRVTIHGFALNLAPDLAAFDTIVPCGLAGVRVTSVQVERGSAPSPEALAPRLADALGQRLGVRFVRDDTALTSGRADTATRADTIGIAMRGQATTMGRA